MDNNVLISYTPSNGASRSLKGFLIPSIVGLMVGFCMAHLFAISTFDKLKWLPYLEQQQDKYFNFDTHTHVYENSTIASKLFIETRILCWIMTRSNNNNNKIKAERIKQTWGKRCNKLLFMSLEKDNKLKPIVLNISDERNNSWAKTKAAFQYIYEYHFDEADWFLKADDDTYVILENLRYMLYKYSPKTPIYFGCKYKPFVKQGYMSGGAGYVLSNEALRRLVENGLSKNELCNGTAAGDEDIEIGKCLEKVEVTAGDSRDEYQRGRFFPFKPEYHLMPSKRDTNFWYWKYIYYKVRGGLDCCSDYAISFHEVSPNQMSVMEYFIYHVRPFGVARLHPDLPKRLEGNGTQDSNFNFN